MVEANSHHYGVTARRMIEKLRREHMRHLSGEVIYDGQDLLLTGIGLLHVEDTDWFSDSSYRNVVMTAADDMGYQILFAARMAVVTTFRSITRASNIALTPATIMDRGLKTLDDA